jgi:hypothetical protein
MRQRLSILNSKVFRIMQVQGGGAYRPSHQGRRSVSQTDDKLIWFLARLLLKSKPVRQHVPPKRRNIFKLRVLQIRISYSSELPLWEYQVQHQRSRFDYRVRQYYLPLHRVQTGSEVHSPGATSLGVERQGRETDYLPPLRTEVKNGGVKPTLPHTSSWRN